MNAKAHRLWHHLRPLWRAWMALARFLGKCNMLLVLTLIYWLVLPFFALYRLADPLALRPRPGRTFWRERPPREPTLEHYFRRH
jgi:hypothetical protein